MQSLHPIANVMTSKVYNQITYRHKTMKATTEVMKAMVERGDALTPETIKALGVRPKRKHGDLRLRYIYCDLLAWGSYSR